MDLQKIVALIEADEKKLLSLRERLDSKGVAFASSSMHKYYIIRINAFHDVLTELGVDTSKYDYLIAL